MNLSSPITPFGQFFLKEQLYLISEVEYKRVNLKCDQIGISG